MMLHAVAAGNAGQDIAIALLPAVDYHYVTAVPNCYIQGTMNKKAWSLHFTHLSILNYYI